MTEPVVRVLHVYEHDPARFEADVNEALKRIVSEGGVVEELKYAIDPSTRENARGGFGALIVYSRS